MMKIKVTDIQAGQRLDQLLVQEFSSASRSWLQKLIKEKKVLLNDQPTKAHTAVTIGDVVTIDYQTPPKPEVTANSAIKLDILDESPDYVIINKPAGLIVHQSTGHVTADTVVNGLLTAYPEIEGVGENAWRPGIVHRLDREVSGVMIVARNQASYNFLKQSFQKRSVKKIYWAVVEGQVSPEIGTIDFPLERSEREGHKMAAKPRGAIGKTAITHYTTLKKFQDYTQLEIQIVTGRTHQIRAHLAAINHPIVGDQIYRPRPKKHRKLPRIALHAKELCLTLQDGQKQCWSTAWPTDLQTFTDNLR